MKSETKRVIRAFIGITSPIWVTFLMFYLNITVAEYTRQAETESLYNFLSGLGNILTILWLLSVIVSFMATIYFVYTRCNEMLTPVILIILCYLIPAFIANGFLQMGVGMEYLKDEKNRSYQKRMAERQPTANISKN